MGFRYPSRQRGLYPSEIYKAPDEEGVYGIFNGSVCLYVGMSEESVQDRLQAHADGNSSAASCINSHYPTHFLWEDESDYSGTARQREEQLIREYRPACNS